ncbi:MAG: prolyl oligopeptidase family serine peptidase [Armatimonadota bacterium]
MRCGIILLLVSVCTLCSESAALSNSESVNTDTQINVMHKAGQTFITWTENGDVNSKYNLYAYNKPITADNLGSAKLAAVGIPSGTGADLILEQWKPLPIIYAKKDIYSSDWYYDILVADEARLGHPKQGYVTSTFGKPLSPGTGLYVRNITNPETTYYAIAILDQTGKPAGPVISTVSPVEEKPGKPEPVLEKLKKCDTGETVRYYTHWSTKDISLKENMPFKFEVQTGSGVGKGKPSSLVILLHGAGGAETLPVPIGENFIVIVPNNYTPGFPFVYDWWYGYNTECIGGDPAKGVNVNFTEKRLLYIIDWAKSAFDIDENRVYLTGGSMGGTGTINFGLRHPEIFAAIYANVPHTSMGDGVSDHESWFAGMWGKRADAVKTNEGINIWDRLNMTAYVADPKNDIPFVKTLNSRVDPAMPWQQIPPFVKAMNDARRGFVSGWGVGMHNLAFEHRPVLTRKFDPFRIVKNESYPAFSNTSINDDPGNGGKENGTLTGQMGGGFDWQILADEKNKWSAKISNITDPKVDVTADITPRRLQKLKVVDNKKYFYTNTDSQGNLLQSGYIEPDDLKLLILNKITITPEGNTVTVIRK